jgi:hypothetical protein
MRESESLQPLALTAVRDVGSLRLVSGVTRRLCLLRRPLPRDLLRALHQDSSSPSCKLVSMVFVFLSPGQERGEEDADRDQWTWCEFSDSDDGDLKYLINSDALH